ncbi:MAG: HEAT repeat domain-containing protein [Candidatus Sericytochromatia bacterium]|nr:HEAT repeat domain-containing protein [Candidatus Sericytochromatia bacterium]
MSKNSTKDELYSPDPAIRLRAIAALQAAGRPEAIAWLVDCLKHDLQPEVRAAAAAAAQALSAQIKSPRDPYGVFRL